MYHVSAQGVDECMINVHYYYYYRDLQWENSCAKGENMAGLSFWKKRGFEVQSEEIQRGRLSEGLGKIISCIEAKTHKKVH